MRKKIFTLLTLCLLLFGCHKEEVHEGQIKAPNSASYYEGKTYKEVVTAFEDSGFTNVKTEKIEDLVTGWLKSDGEVESISVAGDDSFSSSDWFDKDAHVVIFYHTFPEKKEDAKTEKKEDAKTEEVEVIQEDSGDAESSMNEIESIQEDTSYMEEDLDDIENATDEEATEEVSETIESPRDALDKKLYHLDAWHRLEEYGQFIYRYGFKLHYIMGRIAEEPWDDDTWFLKATCTIENEYGNKYDATCEGKVTGTSANPKIVDFYVY